MRQTLILAKEVEQVAKVVLPFQMPAARIGILRGMWQNWQKYWEIVGTQRDGERIRAYARTIEAGRAVQDALVDFYRSTARLHDIESIIESDKRQFERQEEEREAQHILKMESIAADIALARRRRSDAEAQAKIGGATLADSAEAKRDLVLKIGRDYASGVREIDADASMPDEIKEVMRAHLRSVFEQASREVTGAVQSSAPSGASAASKAEQIKRRRARCDADVGAVMSNTFMSDAEKRESVQTLRTECEEDCSRIR